MNTQTNAHTKSEIFSVYNKARKAAHDGKLNSGTVNRALGVIQCKEQPVYVTTIKSCTCEARRWNSSQPCKHMVAKMIETRIEQSKPAAEPEPVTIFVQFEYEGATPFHFVDEPQYAHNVKYSIGKGLINVDDVQEFVETILAGYTMVEKQFGGKSQPGMWSFKTWWKKL